MIAWSSENEACSSILDFLHWLNYLCVRAPAGVQEEREGAGEREEGGRVGEKAGQREEGEREGAGEREEGGRVGEKAGQREEGEREGAGEREEGGRVGEKAGQREEGEREGAGEREEGGGLEREGSGEREEVSNLVFYAQSTITVILGRLEEERKGEKG